MVILGFLFHALGGFAAGSFYLPLKQTKGWTWESGWIVGGLFSWIIVPVVVAGLTVPDLIHVWRTAPAGAMAWTVIWGVMWGVGGLTFGLSVRYLGLSLGYAVALGSCAAFGTLIPAIYEGNWPTLWSTTAGRVILVGLVVCLAGIALCGLAGRRKERALQAVGDRPDIELSRGLLVALFAGIMSACMAFAFTAAKPVAEAAREAGADPLWANNVVLPVVFLGGFATNAVWCGYLLLRRGTWRDFTAATAPLRRNYGLAALAGTIWYLQFMFYGMGSTKLGAYDFTSWTFHMSFIIVTSNLWSLFLREWRGADRRAVLLLVAGNVVIIASTGLIGWGNYLSTHAGK